MDMQEIFGSEILTSSPKWVTLHNEGVEPFCIVLKDEGINLFTSTFKGLTCTSYPSIMLYCTI
jgi:hypothetical protein